MLKGERSTEAPMDFQWTNREQRKPVWASSSEDPSTPRKRPHADLTPTTPLLNTPRTPIFGSNQNVPFIFNQSATPQTPHPHPWAPPPQFSPSKAFPELTSQEELKDVDMSEVSPPEEKRIEGSRTVALGGMRRVYKARQVARINRSSKIQTKEDGNSTEEEEGNMAPMTQNTSNHYTLNMPAPPPPQSDIPYVLLGYLQFSFNLSLILLFLYVVVQFILTVQRDVEQRISEYSMDIVQDIAMCAIQYKNNLCASNFIPAMAQQCANWETCMNRDPAVVGRAKVGAELIAEVVNGFVEPISWKTLAFTLTSLSFLTVFINTLLSLYRSRHHPIPAAPPHQPQALSIPPITPYPPHHFGPIPSWGEPRNALGGEESQTPTRRRRLEGRTAIKIR